VEHGERAEQILVTREVRRLTAPDGESRDERPGTVDPDTAEREHLVHRGHDVTVILRNPLRAAGHEPGARDADRVGRDDDESLPLRERAQTREHRRPLSSGAVKRDHERHRRGFRARRQVVGA